ncbi:hypothetical protein ACQB6R_08095 [Propionibacteriaceae bacterium G1746]|uniref:hypothetical protein n=1 Tax=Aestuariimicrobium sp. G57 TaxID=3418485 RepID=UPI003C26EEDD
MARLALTLGPPQPGGGWSAVTDRGERLVVPATAAAGLRPVTGQRVLAELDESPSDGRPTVRRITIGGTSAALPD